MEKTTFNTNLGFILTWTVILSNLLSTLAGQGGLDPAQRNYFGDDPAQDPAKSIRISFFPVEPNYQQGDNYTFQASVENFSLDKTFHIRVFDEPYHQFSFSIVKEHRSVSVKKLNYYRFLYDQKPFSDKYKQMAIAYGESFSKNVTINDFFEIDDPGLYEITGEFYPMGISEPNYRIPIQPFVMRIHPREQGYSPPAPDSQFLLGRQPDNRRATVAAPTPDPILFPNEVVEKHFTSIRTRDYAGFLSNLDLEKLLVNSYNTTEAFMRFEYAKSYEKMIILEDFKNFLVENIDYTIVDKTILKTVVIDETATVEAVMAVREPFQNYYTIIDPQTGEIKDQWEKEFINKLLRYYFVTFELEKNALIQPSPWKITGYDAQKITLEQYNLYKKRVPISPEEMVAVTEETKSGLIDRIIHFEYNRYEVLDPYIPELKELAQFMIAYPDLIVNLYGYTDDLGEEDYNFGLSQKRVESVMILLVAYGVDVGQIRLFSRGENDPIAPGNTEEERRLNRRVEIKITSPSSP